MAPSNNSQYLTPSDLPGMISQYAPFVFAGVVIVLLLVML